jgi:cytochrome c-type biogenesis protein
LEELKNVNAAVAFLFGLLSFFSPCVLPLLPGYLSLIIGSADFSSSYSRRRAFFCGLAFILGFSAVFVAMGATAGSLGRLLVQHQALLAKLAGVLIIVFGLHVSELMTFKPLMRQLKGASSSKLPGWPGAFLVGMSFAAGWTPCVGPVLASILAMAGSTAAMEQGVLLLAAYSLGLGVPFMLAALGIGVIHQWMQKASKILPYVNAVSGGLLIAMGILLLTGLWNRVILYFVA